MHVLILTEGSREWGLGHLYRCQGFAKHFVGKGIAVDWLVNGDASAERFLASEAIGSGTVLDWTQAGSLDGHLDDCLCAVVDSYHASLECYDRIAEKVPHCIWVDDEARLAYPSGVVVNPNPLVFQRARDSKDGSARLLSGFEHQLLREEFSEAGPREYSKDVRRILVMMGGTDLRQLSPRIVDLLRVVLPEAKVDLVVPSNEQRALWAHLSSPDCILHGVKDAREISELMRSADLAVTAAGQTLCEAASQGLPTLAIGVAENQRLHAEALQRLGAIRLVGWHDDPGLMNLLGADLVRMRDESLRREMGGRGQGAIDGKGVQRIVSAVLDWCELQQLRCAALSDSEHVWRISCQPSVREYSINKGDIPWFEHRIWFENAIRNPELLFYVLEWNGNVVGQLRYKKISSNVAGVSISLSEEIRGHGIAARALKEGDVRCFASWPEVKRVEAEVSPRNVGSIKTFLRSGYIGSDEHREYANELFCIYRKERQHAI